MGPPVVPRPGGAREGEEGEDRFDHALCVELEKDLNNSTSPCADRTTIPRVNGIGVSPARSDARRLAMKEAHVHFGPTEIRWFRLDVAMCDFALRHPQKERSGVEITRWVRPTRSRWPTDKVTLVTGNGETTVICGIDDCCMPRIGMGDLIRAPFCQEAWDRYLHNFGFSPGAVTHELHLCGGESAAAKGGHAPLGDDCLDLINPVLFSLDAIMLLSHSAAYVARGVSADRPLRDYESAERRKRQEA